jgi:putative ABC transport system permease protein
MTALLQFSFKSLVGRRRRFLFLGLAVAFGFFIMVITAGLSEGLLRAVREKGAIYFSGDVNISARVWETNSQEALDAVLVETAAREAVPGAPCSLRTVYYSSDAQLFFAGASVRQRRVSGIDWAHEASELGSMHLIDGRLPELTDEEGAIISETAAKRLGIKTGDRFTLLVSGVHGRNTAQFKLCGIFRDSSIFGYATYVSRLGLNRALSRPDDYATDLVVYTIIGQDERRIAGLLRESLARKADTFPVAASQEQLSALLKPDWVGARYLVCTLDAHLSDIKQILDAISTICYCLLAVFLAIVLLGIANTYRVVVYQRGPEIGMMRAMGMSRSGAVLILIEEAGLLGAISSFVGLAFGLAGLFAISNLNLSGTNLNMDMFLRRGKIAWSINPLVLGGIFAAVCSATLLAAWLPSRKAARISPVEAMRVED